LQNHSHWVVGYTLKTNRESGEHSELDLDPLWSSQHCPTDPLGEFTALPHGPTRELTALPHGLTRGVHSTAPQTH